MAKKVFSKRTLAVLLAVVMVCNLTGILNVFAATTNQVMEGYYVLDAQGNVTDTITAPEYSANGFTVSKRIAQTGVNQFDITLKVVTSQEVITSDAAIQLVIDTSSSMQYCSEDCGNRSCGRHSSRLAAVKGILAGNGGFLDSLTAGNSGKIYVSVVTFGKNATTVCDWTDIKAANGLETVKSAINGLSAPDNATNMHAGLMLARNRLGMSAVEKVNAKFTVVLGDGYANCVGGESNSTTSIALSGRTPASAEATTDGTNSAKTMAATVKGMSKLYTVGYGVEAGYLQGIFGNENVYTGNSATAVTTALSNVAQSAVNGMNGAGSTVTDPMGEYIVLGNVSGLSGVSANGNALTWQLNPANAQKQVSGNVTTYTYEVTYPITLNTAKEGFREDVYYPANGYTYLSVPTDNGTVTVPFYVPAVCGELPVFAVSYEYTGQVPAGAPQVPVTQYYKVGQAVQVAADPALVNYTFSGWDKTDFVMGAENVVIRGSWTQNPKYDYAVSYNANFGQTPATAADEQNVAATYAASYSIDVNENMFSRENHSFIGWAEAPDGAVVYAAGDQLTFFGGGEKTLYAKWIENDKHAYTVIYNGNGGVLEQGEAAYGDSENVADTYATAHRVAVDANTFARENHSFMGWNTQADGSGTAYSAEDVIALSAQDNVRTLYAQWQEYPKYEYSLIYNANFGENETKADSENVAQTYEISHNIVVDENTFVREKYTFYGWNTEADGSGIACEAEDVIALTAQDNTMVLYAQWLCNEYEYVVRYMVRVDDGEYTLFAGELPANAPTGGAALIGQIIDGNVLTGIPQTLSDSNYTYSYTALEGVQIEKGANRVTVYYTYVTPPVKQEEPPVTPVQPPVVDIPDEPVPLTPAPEPQQAPAVDSVPTQPSGLVDIPDAPVPLASVPKTGDPIILYTGMSLLSGLGLLGLQIKKKEDKEA